MHIIVNELKVNELRERGRTLLISIVPIGILIALIIYIIISCLPGLFYTRLTTI